MYKTGYTKTMADRKFPIGPFVKQESYTSQELDSLISMIETIPARFRALVENLSEEALEKKYREDSWTIRQIVHHVADIHYLYYLRMKKVITEPGNKEMTLIDMNAWSALPDAHTARVSGSLLALEGINQRYIILARSLTNEQLNLSYFHPARQLWFNQKDALAIAVWHASHHLGHIKWALEEN